ncbi:MAG: S1 family peptidase [Pseudonocardia sp.]
MAAALVVGMVVAGQGYALAEPNKGDRPGTKPVITEENAGAPPAGFASWSDLMAMQERLDARGERILAARDANFTGIEVDAASSRLTVFWKGEPPAAAAAAMADARGDGVQVEQRPARYSEAELMAEGDRLVQQDGVSAVAPRVDGSGLLVSMLPGRLPVLFSPIPLTMDEASPVAASRGDDFSPYWGGARWNGCSTGFAFTINGARKMLSAGHCGSNGQTANDGGGQRMGTISGDNNSRDRLYINTESSGRIYTGGVGSGESSNAVAGASRSFVGNIVCSSGAYSGTRCNSQVVAVNQTINIGYLVFGTVRAEQRDRQAAIGQGDSGGPSYTATSGNSRVTAKGTHTAIDTSTARPCTGVPSGPGRTCAWRFWYVDVVDSLSAYNGRIVTG